MLQPSANLHISSHYKFPSLHVWRLQFHLSDLHNVCNPSTLPSMSTFKVNIAHFPIIRCKISPIPIGLTAGFLFRGINLQARSSFKGCELVLEVLRCCAKRAIALQRFCCIVLKLKDSEQATCFHQLR